MPAQSVTLALDQFTTFGDLLKYLRRRSGLTQRELSIAVGYSVPQISRLEQNQRLPDLATITARFLPALQAEGEPAIATRLLELAAAVRREDAPAPGLPPYKGLLYFDEADAELFFGREALVDKLLGRVTALPGAAVRFLAVVGASGSGKSSVVRAGLIPALRWQAASADWPVVVCTPTAHPLEALAAALTAEGKPSPSSMKLADALASDAGALLRQVAGRLPTNPAAPQAGLVVVDQFEELFTLCRSETEQAAFVDNLLTAARAAPPAALVVITLRADFYAQCARFDQLRAALAAQQEYIGPMTADELRRAIDEPARRGRWELEPGLVEVLLKDVGADGAHPPEPGALPLLSHALLETWQRRRGQTLTLSGYLASGGVRGAIAETAEAVFHDQLDVSQRAIARQIFLRLTELGAEGVTADTRRRAALVELIPNNVDGAAVREVIRTLADARLITTEQDSAEVAHEALIREWPTLRGWLAEDREGLWLHRHLTEAAQDWVKLGREPDAQYRGARLAQALEWASEPAHDQELNGLEREFLTASQEAAEREAIEREAQRQRELDAARQLAETETARAAAAQQLGETEKRRADEQTRAAGQLHQRALYLLGAFVLAVALAAAALYFGDQARQTAVTAQDASRLAIARELAADAITNLDVDAERSVLLALRAVALADLPETEGALHQAVLANRLQLTLTGHQALVMNVAYSPDGKRLATSSLDKTARVWDAATGKLLLTVVDHTDGFNGIAFSPDGTRIATTSGNTAELWDAATGQLLFTFTGHTDSVLRVAFSPDSRHLVTTSADQTAQMWDVVTHKVLFTVHATNDWMWGVAFRSDGKQFATAEYNGPVTVWDAATGQAVLTLPAQRYNRVVAFSPDGTRLASTDNQRVIIWDAASGQPLLRLNRSDYYVTALAFSPDGTRLAVDGNDARALVWDAATGELLFTLAGHTAQLNGLAFSPDGQHIVTSGGDMTARVWDATPSHESLTIPAPLLAPLPAGPGLRPLAVSPDGRRVAANLTDETVAVWDTVTGQQLLTLHGHTGIVNAIAFNRDGTRLATANDDSTTTLWDGANGQALRLPGMFSDQVLGVAFSPDGARLAVSSADQSLSVFDSATGGTSWTITDPARWFSRVAFSPDGTRLAVAANDNAGFHSAGEVRDAATGQLVFDLVGHSLEMEDIAYSRDGQRLITASDDGTAKIWNATTGQLQLTLAGQTGNIRGVAFSPDGTRVATASRDGTTRLWNAATGELLLTLNGDDTGMNAVAFSPDGRRLFVRTDAAVRVYVLPLDDLVALAKSRVTRSLTPDECQQYLHVSSCPTNP